MAKFGANVNGIRRFLDLQPHLKCGILGSWGVGGGDESVFSPRPGSLLLTCSAQPYAGGHLQAMPRVPRDPASFRGRQWGWGSSCPARAGPPSSHTPKVRFPATGAGGTSILSNCKDLTRSPGQPGSSNTSRKPRTQVERIRCDRWRSASLLLMVPLEREAVRSREWDAPGSQRHSQSHPTR